MHDLYKIMPHLTIDDYENILGANPQIDIMFKQKWTWAYDGDFKMLYEEPHKIPKLLKVRFKCKRCGKWSRNMKCTNLEECKSRMMVVLVDTDEIIWKAVVRSKKNYYLIRHPDDTFGKTESIATDVFVKLGYESKKTAIEFAEISYAPGTWELITDSIIDQEKIEESICFQLNRLAMIPKVKELSLCYTYGTNFRDKIGVINEYKSNRKDKPVGFDQAYEYIFSEKCHDNIDIKVSLKKRKNVETDDVIGMNQTESTVIFSQDKDLRTIPGKYIHPKTFKIETLTLEEANMNLYKQFLTGDVVDTVVGIPGIGSAKAEVLLKACRSEAQMAMVVFKEYINAMRLPLSKRETAVGTFPSMRECMPWVYVAEVAQLIYIKRPDEFGHPEIFNVCEKFSKGKFRYE
jgi:DNA polymerase-1